MTTLWSWNRRVCPAVDVCRADEWLSKISESDRHLYFLEFLTVDLAHRYWFGSDPALHAVCRRGFDSRDRQTQRFVLCRAHLSIIYMGIHVGTYLNKYLLITYSFSLHTYSGSKLHIRYFRKWLTLGRFQIFTLLWLNTNLRNEFQVGTTIGR